MTWVVIVLRSLYLILSLLIVFLPLGLRLIIRSITSYRIRDISRRSFESSEAISKRGGGVPLR
ncbi:MAG TPA: hypothetical protein VF623_06440 [Segetibacter sp.]